MINDIVRMKFSMLEDASTISEIVLFTSSRFEVGLPKSSTKSPVLLQRLPPAVRISHQKPLPFGGKVLGGIRPPLTEGRPPLSP